MTVVITIPTTTSTSTPRLGLGRQGFWVDEHFDAARDGGLSPDEAGAL
jgi:hypothetical protein